MRAGTWFALEPQLPSVSMTNVRAIDLFCGAGGSSWGARNAGASIVAGFDRWSLAVDTFRHNFPEAKAVLADVETIDPSTVAGSLGRVDLMLASPECTNHGPAKGARERCEKSRGTALQVVRFAEALEPRWIVIENVTAMRRWERYPDLIAGLNKLGYRHSEHALNSNDFGVPQRRRRLFILCDREGPPRFDTPKERRERTAQEVVSMDAPHRWVPLHTERRAPRTLERAKSAMAEVGSAPFLVVYYGSDHAGGWQRLDSPLRTITTLDRFAIVRSAPEGPEMRMLQVSELKKAMGMPKNFLTPCGTRREQIMMIGNGVCPPVMEHLVRNLIK